MLPSFSEHFVPRLLLQLPENEKSVTVMQRALMNVLSFWMNSHEDGTEWFHSHDIPTHIDAIVCHIQMNDSFTLVCTSDIFHVLPYRLRLVDKTGVKI
jgi:hypothetical protein